VKLYAQQGYGTGPQGKKIVEGLRRAAIDGAIISPKDYGVERSQELLEMMCNDFPAADRLFDPQFYATLLADTPEARLGNLMEEEYEYFVPRRRAQLESETTVNSDLTSCLEFQAKLPVTALIAPNIVIRQRFNSIEALIAKNFIRNTQRIWNSFTDPRPVYSTLAVDAEALQDRSELEEFLSEIVVVDPAPDGFYLLIHNASSEIPSQLIDARVLGGWMFINHVLNLNGFLVINGFTDILTPFLCAAGGSAGATGWFNTQKVFSMDRFAPPLPGGRRPIYRYLSKTLLKSIRFDELHRLRNRYPAILNGLPTDSFYAETEGSEPADQTSEVLQTWETITSFGDSSFQPRDCISWIQTAQATYRQIDLVPGLSLSGRSGEVHLDSLWDGVRIFSELAELEI
jgi:hypothetical protein